MALTKDERRALELAREAIKSGKQWTLCHALKQAATNDAGLSVAEFRLRQYIADSLSPAFVLSGWQQNNGRFGNHENLTRDRLAWIDWMLGKPLPCEQVEIIWFSKDTVHSAAEYCGREFYAKRLVGTTIHHVFEKTASCGMVKVCESDDFAKINTAIVVHVWPEA